MELNRALVVNQNFMDRVHSQNWPVPIASQGCDTTLSVDEIHDIYDSQVISRQLDLSARDYKDRGLAFYTIGSAGHEANAAIAYAARATDPGFLHYRSGGFMVQRLKMLKVADPIYDLLLSFLAAKEDPVSGGRHKVFGHYPTTPPQTSTIASQCPKALGAAFSIRRAKELQIAANFPEQSVVICSLGDASFNHSTAQGAFNAASWIAEQNYPLPLIWLCEDNGIGISVPTPKSWIAANACSRLGHQYFACDGRDFIAVYECAKQAFNYARSQQKPVFLHFKTVRLLGHAGSDVESQYLTQQQIEKSECDDPLLHAAYLMVQRQLKTPAEIIEHYQATAKKVQIIAEKALQRPRLQSAAEVMASLIPKPNLQALPPLPDAATRLALFGDQFAQLAQPRNLCQLINFALTDLLLRYHNVLVFGEDVGKKGGVYRVTAGLQQRFGIRRVFDTLLDEQTILGHAIGLAHNGFIPIPEIQFLAYYHNAEDQLRGEAATLPFFSNGLFSNPMVIRIAGLAYQKGFGGHFHNDNSIAAIRDIPGIIIACPARGADAAKMLRHCVELAYRERRVVVFLEPIALYMAKDLYQAGDQLWLDHYPEPNEQIALGEINVYGPEQADCAVITFGNGLYLSLRAVGQLQKQHRASIKVIDLRWLKPLPIENLVRVLKGCKKILLVDETRKTGGVSEELLTLLYENLDPMPKTKRVVAMDSFIPLGDAWQYVLPSEADIVSALSQLLVLEKIHG